MRDPQEFIQITAGQRAHMYSVFEKLNRKHRLVVHMTNDKKISGCSTQLLTSELCQVNALAVQRSTTVLEPTLITQTFTQTCGEGESEAAQKKPWTNSIHFKFFVSLCSKQ